MERRGSGLELQLHQEHRTPYRCLQSRLRNQAARKVLALLAVPVQAQMGGGKRGQKSDNTNAADKKPKVDDKAYQEALKRIPEPKQKYDPWAVTKTTFGCPVVPLPRPVLGD
jgi:hypothetical protein